MSSLLNGIDVHHLEQLRDSLINSPDQGKMRYDVTTSWQGGMKSTSCSHQSSTSTSLHSDNGSTVWVDEPPLLAGEGNFPSPQELMLMAFNSCITAAYVAYAVLAGIRLEKLQIKTTGFLDLRGFLGTDEKIIPGSESIQYLITVKGSGSLPQFEALHHSVIQSSPNRWVISQGMLIEGDQIVEQ